MSRAWRSLCLLIVATGLLGREAWGLQSDELLLLVNKNVAAGQALAEFYANARLVPEGRILAIPLPDGDEVSFDAYEREVVPAVRQFLRERGLEKSVRCIVTFYGVPLRIGQRQLAPADKQELATVKAEHTKTLGQIGKRLAEIEAKVAQADPAFKPLAGNDLEHLAAQAQADLPRLGRWAAAGGADEGRARQAEFVAAVRELAGPAGLYRLVTTAPSTQADDEHGQSLRKMGEDIRAAAKEVSELQEKRYDAAARARLRTMAAGMFGLIDLARVMQVQREYLEDGNTIAALDSELALLWWDYYPRAGWFPNPLCYQSAPALNARPTLMVSRLDAPQSGQVRQMILASLKAERDGLRGRVVLDSRGIVNRPGEEMKIGSYAWYDQSIRNLAGLVRTKTKLPLLHDDSPDVLPANSAQEVAIYCGWYSLKNYIPACQFNAGAVGFHVASFELTTLRHGTENLWVRGLINDGVVATLGPVAEPFLGAFPAADDFFGLLLTGKFTLAEVYWKTEPMTSWMMCLIGDPLYNPYRNSPAIDMNDLPARLRDRVR